VNLSMQITLLKATSYLCFIISYRQ